MRNLGLPYISLTKNTVVPERKLKNPCNDKCKLKCSERISEDKRKILFNNYWSTGSLSQQRDFIAKHMTEIRRKYQYKKQTATES